MLHGEIKNLSRGNTAIVTSKIAKELNIEAVELIPAKEYPESYQEMVNVAKKEKIKQARPEYHLAVPDLSDYNEIIIGYPNWWGSYPMVIASFLENYDLAGKTMYPFCTHEGSALGSSMDDLRKSCPNAIIEQGLAIHGSKSDMANKAVKHWVTQLILNKNK